MKKAVIASLAVALAAGGVWYVLQNQKETLPTWIAQSNGRLELNRIDVASLYPGRVKAVLVEEGADVNEGDILAELSSETSNSRLEEARAAELRQEEAVGAPKLPKRR
jgi:hlyD family secretion protein